MPFFRPIRYASKKVDETAYQMFTAAMQNFVYGTFLNTTDEYVKIHSSARRSCIEQLAADVVKMFKDCYLRL